MEDLATTFHQKHFIEDTYSYIGPSKRCIICGEIVSYNCAHFYCRVCGFRFHKECPTNSTESNLTINRPETHEHTLTFIRKMNSFKCDACGKVYPEEMNMYGCLQCSFFVHRECIYLPKVIKLTRHSHRLVHTFQVRDSRPVCGVCKDMFGYEYGGYICINKTCGYKLHSYCATSREIWDGKDVQGEDEEISNSEDVASSASLVEVDGKTFRHFSHQHDLMRLCVNDDDDEEDGRRCQACVLPIDFGSFLACKECDFALHDTCATLPRKMEHLFHRHPLALHMNIKEGFFTCSKCERESCGFMYQCNKKECEFKMDAKCGSLTDPLYYGGHPHPMTVFDTYAVCYKCVFGVTFGNLTLPSLIKCKYDTHPLTICSSRTITKYDESVFCEITGRTITKYDVWCEICEVEIKKHDHQDLYGCTICNTIMHVECAIGKYPFLKPGHTIKVNGFEIEIASNTLSRPICHACRSTCLEKLVFKNKTQAVTFCSIDCITSSSSESSLQS